MTIAVNFQSCRIRYKFCIWTFFSVMVTRGTWYMVGICSRSKSDLWYAPDNSSKLRLKYTLWVFSKLCWLFCHFATLGYILTFTFVVWIVNRFERIPLQNSSLALKANEHSLWDINRVNIATSDSLLLFPRLLKALRDNSIQMSQSN